MPLQTEPSRRADPAESARRSAEYWGSIVNDGAQPMPPMDAALPSGFRVHIQNPVALLDKSAGRLGESEPRDYSGNYNRIEALAALGALHGTAYANDGVAKVLPFLNDPDESVQAAACRSLGALGVRSPQVREALLAKGAELKSADGLRSEAAFDDLLQALISLGENGVEARSLYSQVKFPYTQLLIARHIPEPLELIGSKLSRALTEESPGGQKFALEVVKELGPKARPLLRNLVRLGNHLTGDPIAILGGVPASLLNLRDEAVTAVAPSWPKLTYEKAAYWVAERNRCGWVAWALDGVFRAVGV